MKLKMFFLLMLVIGFQKCQKSSGTGSIVFSTENSSVLMPSSQDTENLFGSFELELSNISGDSIVLELSHDDGIPDLQTYQLVISNCRVDEVNWLGAIDPYYIRTDTVETKQDKKYHVFLQRHSLPVDDCEIRLITIAYQKLKDIRENVFRNNYHYVYIPIGKIKDDFRVFPAVYQLDIVDTKLDILLPDLGITCAYCNPR